MAMFVLNCVDHPDALERRMGARPAHIEYVQQHSHLVKLAGSLLDAKGGMIGSMFIFETDDVQEVLAFNANDPYVLSDVFANAELRPFRLAVNNFA